MNKFLQEIRRPVVIVSTLKEKDRKSVIDFLLKLNAPVYLEAVSGLREESKLSHLRITRVEDQPLDSVLRIGGVPTLRFWRDLENMKDVRVLSLNDLPFSGLSHGDIICDSISNYLDNLPNTNNAFPEWKSEKKRSDLFQKYPKAEPSLIHMLSEKIPEHSLLYLGNSMPIRYWDMAATYRQKNFKIYASRGLNGIDGQISTFLGLATEAQENWAIIGDQTALYDQTALWILKQLKNLPLKIVVINNGGGKIFENKFAEKEFQNCHSLNFEYLAKFWGIDYNLYHTKQALLELTPSNRETKEFLKEQKYEFNDHDQLAKC